MRREMKVFLSLTGRHGEHRVFDFDTLDTLRFHYGLHNTTRAAARSESSPQEQEEEQSAT
jgi:hypothetical protein